MVVEGIGYCSIAVWFLMYSMNNLLCFGSISCFLLGVGVCGRQGRVCCSVIWFYIEREDKLSEKLLFCNTKIGYPPCSCMLCVRDL